MKTRLVLLFGAVLLVQGCPRASDPPHPPATTTWVAHAEKTVSALEAVVAAVESGDKASGVEAYKRAYYECYDPDLEPASKTNLPEEMLDGKLRNVIIVREDAFSDILEAVKNGAPAATVRAQVAALAEKIRGDAKKLDDMKVPPPK